MIKKITAVMLCFMILFSLCTYAENLQDDETVQTDIQTDTPPEIPQNGMGGRGGTDRGPGGMGAPPEGFDPSQRQNFHQGGNVERNAPFTPGESEATDSTTTQDGERGTASDTQQGNQMYGDMGRRGGRGENFAREDNFTEGGATEVTEEVTEEKAEENSPLTLKSFITTYQTPIISVILLALAFVFVIFYKRKNY